MLGKTVVSLDCQNSSIQRVICADGETFDADFVISSMPLKELIMGIRGTPKRIQSIAESLEYRNFVTVGLRVPKTLISNSGLPLGDQWLYIQDHTVALGRIQILDNWSDALNPVPGTVCLGLEYFCSTDDPTWLQSDDDWIQQANKDISTLRLFSDEWTEQDNTVIRCEKAYPCYWGGFHHVNELLHFTGGIRNLFCVGRNGCHSYSNMDQVMLSAMKAVECIIAKDSHDWSRDER